MGNIHVYATRTDRQEDELDRKTRFPVVLKLKKKGRREKLESAWKKGTNIMVPASVISSSWMNLKENTWVSTHTHTHTCMH